MQQKNKKPKQPQTVVSETPEAPKSGSEAPQAPVAPSLSDILNAVVADVSQPSPIADMPQQSSPQPAAPTIKPQQPANGSGKRGRPALTPEEKAIRKQARANGSFVKAETAKPTLNGIPHITPSPMAGQEGIEPCAQIATSMVAFSGMAMGGELAAMRPEEMLLVKDGFVSYFRAKGVNNVPPWVILCGAMAPYYMRVFTQTPAKGKAALFMQKAGFGIKHIFGKLRNARSNRRDNNERKNDGSEKAGTDSKSE